MNADLFILNDGSPTRLPDRNDHNPSAIDITLISPTLAPLTTWEVVPDELGSDHLPINIHIENGPPQARERARARKFNYTKADWERFNRLLSNTPIPTCTDIDGQYSIRPLRSDCFSSGFRMYSG
jgi:hypothetical protein